MCATGNPLFSIFFKKVFIRPQKGVITISKHVRTSALKLASCLYMAAVARPPLLASILQVGPERWLLVVFQTEEAGGPVANSMNY